MKKFSELSAEEFRNVVMNSKELCEKLYGLIADSEMVIIEDKISTVKDGLKDWSVGGFNDNYLLVDDASAFLEGVRDSIETFGGGDDLENDVSHCSKLNGTNLFRHYAERLANLYLEDELQPICDYISDCYDETHGYGDFGKNVGDYLDVFLEDVGDYLYDDESKLYYVPARVWAA